MLKGAIYNEEAERIERETAIPIPMTQKKVDDKSIHNQ
jgi:hypothetical protein